jgi:hypothetical protein
MLGLAMAAFALALLVPSARSAILPLLVVAACPIGMLVMMRGMARGRSERPAESGPAAEAERPRPSVDPKEHEIARLRAEVDQLRAERRSAPSAGGSVPDARERAAPSRRPGEDRAQ